MMDMERTVTVDTVEVGQAFGCCAVIRDARSGRKIAKTRTRPYGCDAAAMADAEAFATARGWRVDPGGAS